MGFETQSRRERRALGQQDLYFSALSAPLRFNSFYPSTIMNKDPRTQAIIGAAIEVHRRLGPGLLETAYRKCLAYELRKRGHHVVEEQPIPVVYDDLEMGANEIGRGSKVTNISVGV